MFFFPLSWGRNWGGPAERRRSSRRRRRAGTCCLTSSPHRTKRSTWRWTIVSWPPANQDTGGSRDKKISKQMNEMNSRPRPSFDVIGYHLSGDWLPVRVRLKYVEPDWVTSVFSCWTGSGWILRLLFWRSWWIDYQAHVFVIRHLMFYVFNFLMKWFFFMSSLSCFYQTSS